MRNVFLAATLFFAFSFAGNGPVSYYGKLKVREGRSFIDGVKEGREDIKLVQIRGVSFGWSTTGWESARFYNAAAVERVAKDWKAEVVRAAYGATSTAFAAADAAANRERIETVVKAAIENDIYVIIDWHSHNAHNEVQNSKDFFEYMAKNYGDCDNVIFEIYNEPNCSNGSSNCSATGKTTWAQIKTYAEAIIPIIRKYSHNLILVGTPEWSQRVENVQNNAIDDENVGYVLHFYAATHSLSAWKSNIDNTISQGLPIFVTEYGTTTSDGGQPASGTSTINNYNSHSANNSNEWHSYMDSKKISSVAWNINDKYEGSAFFGTVNKGVFDQSPENWSDTTKMTASGKYIFKKLAEYYKTAPWNSNTSPIKPPVPALTADLLQTGDVSVEIFSLQGKKMGNSVYNLKNGAYILFLRQGSQTKIIKIVKK
ncbi:endoglucanase [Fibrobacteria bacterium R8-3-H12]